MAIKKHVYLLGFMGAGKTSAGIVLAEKTGMSFTDLDEFIVTLNGRTIPEIFEEEGEAGFRKLEQEALKKLKADPQIVATGGGIVETNDVLNWMAAHGTTVYLQAPFHILYERIKNDENRPLTAHGKQALNARFNSRKACYESAEFVVNTENRTVQDVVDEIAGFI